MIIMFTMLESCSLRLKLSHLQNHREAGIKHCDKISHYVYYKMLKNVSYEKEKKLMMSIMLPILSIAQVEGEAREGGRKGRRQRGKRKHIKGGGWRGLGGARGKVKEKKAYF